ncbi:unnamed protein product [Onchocerca flexuosa]|uniref:Uncharacterized protein n=1 Tax=Onchocerca flexuosa TaxID=387005 RepID=A0A183I810_9BILA|nr:unnamed protein product [Onchocerca flexuosa]
MALFWRQTVFLFGQKRSVVLMVLLFESHAIVFRIGVDLLNGRWTLVNDSEK